ncbi:hypothetical protein NM688_g7081 [Phlebia brevispora]|uniref:Uncharacterized protein n=1 Tax=Phlebia brevispora TaxID=194682 RepID=A0ACC1S9C3_9APHY|nr:hypothetical protein NM688_g7081 [Phlebia brevispora]
MSAALYTRSFLEILRRTKTSGSLVRADVICSNMLELWSLGDFLSHAGRNVEHVKFNVSRLYEGEIPEIADHVRKCLSLAPSCSSLETLTLRLNLDPLNDRLTSAMFTIVPCLMRHAPASLQKVVIELDLPLSKEGLRRTREVGDVIHFVDKCMTVDWSYLALAAKEYSIQHIQVVWRTGAVYSPDVAEQLTAMNLIRPFPGKVRLVNVSHALLGMLFCAFCVALTGILD